MKKTLILCMIILSSIILTSCASEQPSEFIVNDFLYHVNPIDLNNTVDFDVEIINNYSDFQTSNLQDTYSEEFFDEKKLIYIVGINGNVSDTVLIESILIYENDLNVFYTINGALTAPYNYEIIVEIGQNLSFNDVYAHVCQVHIFENESEDRITLFSISETVFILYETEKEIYISDAELEPGAMTIIFSNVYFEGLSTSSETITYYFMDEQIRYLEYDKVRFDYIEE